MAPVSRDTRTDVNLTGESDDEDKSIEVTDDEDEVVEQQQEQQQHRNHSSPTKKATTTTTTTTSASTSSKPPTTPSTTNKKSSTGSSSSTRSSSKSPKPSSGGSAIPSGSTSSRSRSPQKSPRSGGGKRRPARRPKKKGITFKKTVGVHTIPNLDTYSIPEKESAWFAPDDYGQMEDECDLTAEILDRNKPLFPGQCPRGLEAWTTEGEQRKEGHVQLAIDIVWQAQLEQWKASSDIHECWEFIRTRYLAVSVPCHKLAHKKGRGDEKEVYAYLAGVRSVERNRLRVLGIHMRSSGGSASSSTAAATASAATPRSASGGKKKIGRAYSAMSPPGGNKQVPGRNHSFNNIKTPSKGVLKRDTDDEAGAKTPVSTGGRGKIKHSKTTTTTTTTAPNPLAAALAAASAHTHTHTHTSAGIINTTTTHSDDLVSVASSKGSGRGKISYKPRSRAKVPTSPVASVLSCVSGSNDSSDGDSRRMRSHMSVASDDSTRRRMLRTVKIKPPL
jgi:hypothetical protein